MSTLPAVVRELPLKKQKLWKQLYKQFMWEQEQQQKRYHIKTQDIKYDAKYYFQVIALNLSLLACWQVMENEKLSK